MSLVTVTESYLSAIADAIRAKLDVATTYTPAQMAGAIESIPTASPAVLVSKTITANGTYDPADDDADGYDEVTVNVSGGGQSYTASAGQTTDFLHREPTATFTLSALSWTATAAEQA